MCRIGYNFNTQGGGVMSNDAGVFLLNNDESIVPLQAAQFVSEDEFQKLLSRFPELLVGGQIDPTRVGTH
jgi:hypothetical protein